MRRAPRLLPVHRHTSGHQGQVQDHQQGLLLQVRSEITRDLLADINLPLPCRYSGRTQKQMQEHVRENFVKRQSFQR